VEWYWQWKTTGLGEKPVTVSLCPPQSSHKQAWECPRFRRWEVSDLHPELLNAIESVTTCELCVRKIDIKMSFVIYVLWIVGVSNSFFLNPFTMSCVWVTDSSCRCNSRWKRAALAVRCLSSLLSHLCNLWCCFHVWVLLFWYFYISSCFVHVVMVFRRVRKITKSDWLSSSCSSVLSEQLGYC
jgi:hypothetical protein